MTKDINRTKHEDGDDVDHGKYAKTHVQLSSRSWNKIPAPEYNPDSEHPSPEMLLLREAIKYLTPKQRKVWEYHAYDKLTQDEIAAKIRISQQAVAKHIAASEARIVKWCKSNMGAYELLKSDFERFE